METTSRFVGARGPRRSWALLGLLASALVGCGGGSTITPTASPLSSLFPTTTAAEGEGVLGEWVSSGGFRRTYALHVPPACDGTRPCPVIVAFHGAGGSQAFAESVGLNRAADRRGFVVAAPDGLGGDWAMRCNGCTVADQQGVDDVRFVGTLVNHLAARMAIDTSRVYATGRSDGGSFTYRLACDYPLAGAAVVAGTLFHSELCHPARRISLEAFHGTADNVIPIAQGAGPAQLWAGLDGCSTSPVVTHLDDKVDDGTTVTRYDFPGCPGSVEVVFFSVEGGGHNWPGSPTLESAGLQTRDIEASEEMVDFFARHTVSASRAD